MTHDSIQPNKRTNHVTLPGVNPEADYQLGYSRCRGKEERDKIMDTLLCLIVYCHCTCDDVYYEMN